mmetsp:Transcript_15154/g.39008  ORF Transcript_15154/g.39008 Transcript_15154/m.39008 type:complete len:253 (+) Transcript_15154:828-1586(+)
MPTRRVFVRAVLPAGVGQLHVVAFDLAQAERALHHARLGARAVREVLHDVAEVQVAVVEADAVLAGLERRQHLEQHLPDVAQVHWLGAPECHHALVAVYAVHLLQDNAQQLALGTAVAHHRLHVHEARDDNPALFVADAQCLAEQPPDDHLALQQVSRFLARVLLQRLQHAVGGASVGVFDVEYGAHEARAQNLAEREVGVQHRVGPRPEVLCHHDQRRLQLVLPHRVDLHGVGPIVRGLGVRVRLRRRCCG